MKLTNITSELTPTSGNGNPSSFHAICGMGLPVALPKLLKIINDRMKIRNVTISISMTDHQRNNGRIISGGRQDNRRRIMRTLWRCNKF